MGKSMELCRGCAFGLKKNFKFCPNCGIEIYRPSNCSKCSSPIDAGSKFCQECGTKVEDDIEEVAQVPSLDGLPDPVDSGITIEFPFSTSQNFDVALNIAKKFDSFQKFGHEKKAIYRVHVNESEIESLLDLADALKGWRKKTVYLNGEKSMWDTVFKFQWCFNQKKSSFKPEYYCFGYESEWQFNLWGCFQSRLLFRDYSDLFKMGKWLNQDGDWQFDKERIMHELQKNLHPYRFCPAMNVELINDVLDAFPNVVNPKKDINWKFIETSAHEPNALSYTIRDEYYTETRYLVGVTPINREYIRAIVSKLKQRLPDFINKNV